MDDMTPAPRGAYPKQGAILPLNLGAAVVPFRVRRGNPGRLQLEPPPVKPTVVARGTVFGIPYTCDDGGQGVRYWVVTDSSPVRTTLEPCRDGEVRSLLRAERISRAGEE